MAESIQLNNRGGSWGDNRFQNYYNRYLSDLPLNTVNYDRLSTQERDVQELAAEQQAYLEPQLDTLQKNTRRSMRNEYNNIDANLAGRNMSRSTVVTDQKNAVYNAGMSTLSNAYSNYMDNLLSGVQQALANQDARRQAIDKQNAANELEARKWNSQIETAQMQNAYQRAAEAYERTKPKATKKSGSSKPKNEYKKPEYKMDWLTKDGKKQITVRDSTKRRMSGQSSGL